MRNRRWAVGAAIAALALGAAACSSSDAETNGKGGTSAPDATVKITPADGSGKVRPDAGVTVAADGGKLDQVNAVAGGKPVDGDFNADHTQWKSRWTLAPGASYTVTASAKNIKGKPATANSKFSVAKVSGDPITIADITPQPNEKVGVGMPIIVQFSKPVANRAFVEKALEVKADKGDVGAWHWDSDTQVTFRTKVYWQSHQNVTFTAHLAGVRAAKGLYGKADVTKRFKIGASNVVVANSKTHYAKINHDGKIKRVPISTGVGTTTEYTTTSGIHLTKEKAQVVEMESPGRKKGDPGYYKETEYWAVRISDRGEYFHQSAGEYECLGKRNCSHGCVRTSPKGAKYFYGIAQRGDVVNVTGTRRKLVNEQGNGWTMWTLSWNKWLKGSALPH